MRQSRIQINNLVRNLVPFAIASVLALLFGVASAQANVSGGPAVAHAAADSSALWVETEGPGKVIQENGAAAPFMENLPVGTTVTLRAVPDPGAFLYYFGARCASGTIDSVCTVTITSGYNHVLAIFSSDPVFKLTVTESGNGKGTVTNLPPYSAGRISCPSKCNDVFAGTLVEVGLEATPDQGSMFVGWKGGGCFGVGACNVRLKRNETVDAEFEVVPHTPPTENQPTPTENPPTENPPTPTENPPTPTTPTPTTVEVKTGTVRVEGTQDSSSTALARKYADELKKAARGETDAKLKKDLESTAADQSGLTSQATAMIDGLKAGDDAETFAHVTVDGNQIIIINIETLPPNAPKELRDHEDGHASINVEIAKKLGAALVAKYKGQPNADDQVSNALINAQTRANQIYDDATQHGTQGNQHHEAQKAIEQALRELDQTGLTTPTPTPTPNPPTPTPPTPTPTPTPNPPKPAPPTPTPPPNPPTLKCVGSPMLLFNNWNGDAVQNGGSESTFSTNGQSYCLISISTYHWNGGYGSAPGTISLLSETGSLGPWQAVGNSGQGGALNVDWTVTPGSPTQPVIINGDYVCEDSNPATWSQDAASGGAGFCKVWVEQLQTTGSSSQG